MARIFIYDGREFPDPDPSLTPEKVRDAMADFLPDLLNAEVTQRPQEGADTVFDLRRRVGTKGSTPREANRWASG